MPRQRRIDLATAARAIRRGESLTSYAARTGFTPGAVREVLRAAGIRVLRKQSTTDPRLYSIWRSIRSRCERRSDPAYPRYGALGVRVCSAWQTFATFQAWAQEAGWKPGKCLVLQVPARGYRPSNCRWGTRQEAARLGITAFGETKSASAWARDARARVNAQTIRDRVRDGVEPEDAITEVWLRHPARGEASAYASIDWRKVQALQHLGPVAIARRLGRSSTAIRRGMRERGWWKRPTRVRELQHGEALHGVWSRLRDRGTPGTWPDFAAFHAWALSAGYRPGLHLTRLDRAKPHGRGNCAWLPAREAMRYRRPTKTGGTVRRRLRAFGKTKGAAEWAKDPRCVVTLAGLLARLDRGIRPAKAITGKKRREGAEPEGAAIEAWGTTKSLAAWARDRRARVNAGAIARRIRAGWSPEKAIGTGAFRGPRG